jgi:hypothetical protein
MSRRYLERMSTRISAGASNLVRLWRRKIELVGQKAFDADMDLQLATMVSGAWVFEGRQPMTSLLIVGHYR